MQIGRAAVDDAALRLRREIQVGPSTGLALHWTPLGRRSVSVWQSCISKRPIRSSQNHNHNISSFSVQSIFVRVTEVRQR